MISMLGARATELRQTLCLTKATYSTRVKSACFNAALLRLYAEVESEAGAWRNHTMPHILESLSAVETIES